jgi:hypothetical protein
VGYLKLWRQNLLALALVLALVGSVIGVVAVAHGKGGRPGPGDRAVGVRVVVTGAAPKGVAVSLGDANGSTVLAGDHRVPFRTLVPVDGSSFYTLQAQLLGGGSITCTIALGVVVEVHHASGGHDTCTAGVAENTRGSGWHTS